MATKIQVTSTSKKRVSPIKTVQIGNGRSVLARIKESKTNPDRNKSYMTLVQTNTYSQPCTTEESMRANSQFILNCKF